MCRPSGTIGRPRVRRTLELRHVWIRTSVAAGFVAAIFFASAAAPPSLTAVQSSELIVGVSWAYFQEERWKTDEGVKDGGDTQSATGVG